MRKEMRGGGNVSLISVSGPATQAPSTAAALWARGGATEVRLSERPVPLWAASVGNGRDTSTWNHASSNAVSG
jgi:hypothetical protein